MTVADTVDRIVAMTEFQAAFSELKNADQRNGTALEEALVNSVKQLHDHIRESSDRLDALRYYLYREAVEIKAQAAVFLNYEREMAQRETALWRFALERNEDFFRAVYDAMDEYFGAKASVMIAEVDRDATWYSGLRDTAKKSGALVKGGLGLLRKAAEYVRERPLADVDERAKVVVRAGAELGEEMFARAEDAVDIRDTVQKAVETHLAPAVVGHDVEAILSEAGKRYEAAWTEQIKAQAPDLAALKSFACATSDVASLSGGFELGRAEQTLAVGLGGAVAGTFSLAAGWHTLAYAMAHVFYPVAMVVAAASVGVAVLDQERALERRRQRVRDAVKQAHRNLLVELETGAFDGLGQRTLRQWLMERSKEIVTSTVRGWERAISGDLTGDHYRRLGASCTAHLQLIGDAIDALSVSDDAGSPSAPKSAIGGASRSS
jgi:hypothetical protein